MDSEARVPFCSACCGLAEYSVRGIAFSVPLGVKDGEAAIRKGDWAPNCLREIVLVERYLLMSGFGAHYRARDIGKCRLSTAAGLLTTCQLPCSQDDNFIFIHVKGITSRR